LLNRIAGQIFGNEVDGEWSPVGSGIAPCPAAQIDRGFLMSPPVVLSVIALSWPPSTLQYMV
jgi:hypothetical protein